MSALTTLLMMVVGSVVPANALSGSDFDPGRIVSDSVFHDSAALDSNQIQEFLNSKLSACKSGYTCLKDFRMDTFDRAAVEPGHCTAYSGAANESASTIIAKASQACGISPKVLLVLLQKETSLITSTSPTAGTYRKAAGYGCPDTSSCDAAYYGFYNQVYMAAWQFRQYTNHPDRRFKIGNIAVGFNPNAGCGSSVVNIQNQATANLYNYTPYQPNTAALANLYGWGDACSSYGNRNFWRMYSDWFGSTLTGLDSKDATSLVHALYNDILIREPDAGGVSTWHGYLIGRGWPTVSVANGILYSDEYFLQRIDAAYREVLGREPDENGRYDWLSRMRSGQTSVDEIRMTFTSSMEYYMAAGGNDHAYVSVLYSTLLGRPAAQGDLDYWASQASLYGGGYLVSSIWNSYESGTIRLNAIYTTYLKRGVDASGVSSWVPLITAQGDQAARTTIVSSLEYLLQARARYPQP